MTQLAFGQCVSPHGYSLSLKSHTEVRWVILWLVLYLTTLFKFPCFSSELVKLGDRISLAVLCLCSLCKMGISMFNNLNSSELGRLKVNSSTVKTPIVYHHFFLSSLSLLPGPESIMKRITLALAGLAQWIVCPT